MKLSAIASALNARLENGSIHPATTTSTLPASTASSKLVPRKSPSSPILSIPRLPASPKPQPSSYAEDFPAIPAATLRVADPYLAFAHALELFHQPQRYAPGVHATAVIDPTARIGRGAHIGPYVVIGENVEIGDHAVLARPRRDLSRS